MPSTDPHAAPVLRCKHGVEAGNYCAKCGREVVRGPVVGSAAKCRGCGGPTSDTLVYCDKCYREGIPSAASARQLPNESKRAEVEDYLAWFRDEANPHTLAEANVISDALATLLEESWGL